MDFFIPSKSAVERLWVVGDYVMRKSLAAFRCADAPTICEMRQTKEKNGAQGLDCSRQSILDLENASGRKIHGHGEL